MKYLAIFLLSILSQNAYSSMCMSFFDSRIAKERGVSRFVLVTERASLIFVGTAEVTLKKTLSSTGYEDSIVEISTRFNVENILKGPSLKKVNISGSDGCGCKYDFKPGVTYIVHASGSEEQYSTIDCNYIKQNGSQYLERYKEFVGSNETSKSTP